MKCDVAIVGALIGGEPFFEIAGKTHFKLGLDGAETSWAEIVRSFEALVGDGWANARIKVGSEPLPPPSADFSEHIHAHLPS